MKGGDLNDSYKKIVRNFSFVFLAIVVACSGAPKEVKEQVELNNESIEENREENEVIIDDAEVGQILVQEEDQEQLEDNLNIAAKDVAVDQENENNQMLVENLENEKEKEEEDKQASTSEKVEPVTQKDKPLPLGNNFLKGEVRGISGVSAGVGLPEFGSKLSYIVMRGDSLSKVSKKIYGHSRKWKELAGFSGFKNPNMIFPGDVVYYQLTKESLSFALQYENRPRKETIVLEGEDIVSLTKRIYGTSPNWRVLWRYNKSLFKPYKA